MSGYADPFSGIFNIYVFMYFGWAGLIVLAMAAIFVGFDNGGFLHKLEERFGIKRPKGDRDDEFYQDF